MPVNNCSQLIKQEMIEVVDNNHIHKQGKHVQVFYQYIHRQAVQRFYALSFLYSNERFNELFVCPCKGLFCNLLGSVVCATTSV